MSIEADVIGRADAEFAEALAEALDIRERETGAHSKRVACHTLVLARRFTSDGDQLRQIYWGSLLHDVGKIGIPDYVLLKPGVLDGEEWRAMQSHPERGQRIVLAIGVDGVEEIGLAVRHHHENFDGGGYPDALAGEHIPYAARMLAIADAYDAMGIPQPYQQRRGHDQIMDILDDESGRRFDPYLVARFAAMIGHSNWKAPAS